MASTLANETAQEFDMKGILETQLSIIRTLEKDVTHDSLSKACTSFAESYDIDARDSLDSKNVQRFCILCYNHAAVNYHSMNYNAAESILSKLVEWKGLPDISCAAVHRIRLLYIDTLIRLKKFVAALGQIEHFEFLRAQAESELSKSPSPENGDSVPGKSEHDTDFYVKTKIQYCKTYCCLSTRAFKFAKRECKILFGLLGTSSQGHVGAMHLKAYQEYLRGNMTKALTLIRSISPGAIQNIQQVLSSSGELISVFGPNNEGCCQFYLGRPLSAGVFFKKAIVAYDEDVDSTNLPIHAVNYKRNLIDSLYNFGIACLHAKDTDRAFYCLMGCTKLFGANPRLWLRIAECCIQKFKASNESDMQWTDEKRNLLDSIKCSNFGAPKLVLSDNFNASNGNKTEISDSTKTNQPTLSFGLTCIKTALSLIKSERSGGNVSLQVPPSNPLTSERAISSLRASILCAGSYICLNMEDYSTAAKFAEELLRIPNIVGVHRYLGKQYLSQALFMIGSTEQAISALDKDENDVDLSYCVSPIESMEDRREDAADSSWANANTFNESNGTRKPLQVWHPKDEMTAKMIRVYNRACLLTCCDQLDQADIVLREWMTKSAGIQLPPEFLMLAVSLHMRRGNYGKAVSLLKEHSPTAPVT